MPLAECLEPNASELAISEPQLSATRFLTSDIAVEHDAYWLHVHREGEGGYRELGGGMVNLIRDRYQALEDAIGRGDLLQPSAEFISAMGLSMLLRTEPFQDLPLNFLEDQPDEPGQAGFYLDVYTPDAYSVHAGPELLDRFPAPQGNTRDMWYQTDDSQLYVHRQQPPEPTAGALEQNADVFDGRFYETFATLIPLPARPDSPLPSLDELLQ